jgi:hypothetical protein
MTAFLLSALTRVGIIVVSAEAAVAIVLAVLIVVVMARIAKNKKRMSVYRREIWRAPDETEHKETSNGEYGFSQENGQEVVIIKAEVKPYAVKPDGGRDESASAKEENLEAAFDFRAEKNKSGDTAEQTECGDKSDNNPEAKADCAVGIQKGNGVGFEKSGAVNKSRPDNDNSAVQKAQRAPTEESAQKQEPQKLQPKPGAAAELDEETRAAQALPSEDAQKRALSMGDMYSSLKKICGFDNAEADIDADDDAEECGAKITFTSKMKQTSAANKLIYNILKNEILSYRNIKSRVTNGGDYFRFPGTQFAKIVLIGKTLRLAIALDPSEYEYNIYHQKDRGGMIKYAATPMFIKVQSRLGVERAVKLIGDCMERNGIKKAKKFAVKDYAAEIDDSNCRQSDGD